MRPTSLLPSILLYAIHIQRSDGLSAFIPNCTCPPSETSYVSGPNIRSSLSIFWSATSIIVLCTWNILHLNVPRLRRPTKSKLKKLWWKVWDTKTKVKWMIFTFLVPEYILGKAISEAKASKAIFADEEKSEIHTVRTYLANIGYFVLDWGDPLAESSSEEGDENGLKERNATLQQVVDETLNDNSVIDWQRINVSRFKSRFWALNAWQWDVIRRCDVACLPEIPDWQLEKLDSSSVIAKILVIIQVSYLIVQLIVRQVEGHPSTQLEISALAFSACSLVTYIAYWNRPQDVAAVFFIKAKATAWSKNDLADLIRDLIYAGPRYMWIKPRFQSRMDNEVGPEPIPNDATHKGPEDEDSDFNRIEELVPLTLGALFGGSLFGGLHCLAWNSEFPTPGEALGWRICSIATTCIPAVSVLPVFIWMLTSENFTKHAKGKLRMLRRILATTCFGFLAVPYVLARLFLVVETFRSLFFLPAGAFASTWADSVPHVG